MAYVDYTVEHIGTDEGVEGSGFAAAAAAAAAGDIAAVPGDREDGES